MYQSNNKVKYLSNSLKHNISDQDNETIKDITDKKKEKHDRKKKTHLYTKFNNLKNATVNNINNITPAKKVINHSGKELRQKQKRSFKLRLNICSNAQKTTTCMDIILTKEVCVLELENDEYFEKAER